MDNINLSLLVEIRNYGIVSFKRKTEFLDLETEIPLEKRNSEFRNNGVVGFRKKTIPKMEFYFSMICRPMIIISDNLLLKMFL